MSFSGSDGEEEYEIPLPLATRRLHSEVQMEERAQAEYEEPRFQQRSSESVGKVPGPSGNGRQALRTAVSNGSQFLSKSSGLELIGLQGTPATRKSDSVERASGGCCGNVLPALVLGLTVVAVAALVLGSVAVRARLCSRDFSRRSNASHDGFTPLQIKQRLRSLQQQVQDLRALAGSGSVPALVGMTPLRCTTHTRVCAVSSSLACDTEAVSINVDEVYPFGTNCSLSISNSSADQVQSTAGSVEDIIRREGLAEPVTTTDGTFCRCRIRRREPLFLNAQLGDSVQCRLNVILCPLLLNTTTTI